MHIPNKDWLLWEGVLTTKRNRILKQSPCMHASWANKNCPVSAVRNFEAKTETYPSSKNKSKTWCLKSYNHKSYA